MSNTVRSFALAIVSLTLLSSLTLAQPGRARAAKRTTGNASGATAMHTSQSGTQTMNANAGQRMAGRRGPVEKSSGEKPTGANLSAQQQQNLQKLQTDLQSIKQGSTVTEAQITALKNDLLAMADGATKPDSALVQKLATDVSNALADSKLTNAEKAKLAQDLDAIMDSANLPEAEVQKAISDAQALLAASGVTKDEVQTVVKDLQAIATEARKNVQSASGNAKSRWQGLKQKP